MNVLIDANVILSDPWQESARSRALRDFVGKTRGRILVHEVTLQEVGANLERSWREALGKSNSAGRSLQRLRLIDFAAHDEDRVLSEARDNWSKATKKYFPRWNMIPSESALLPELMRRAAYRIPPCSRSGEEIRDALMWLGALRYCSEKGTRDLVFISGNTRDFLGSDGELLPALKEDAIEHEVRISYYSSLEEFLKEHAEPIQWLTLEWVESRLDKQEIDELLWEAVARTEAKEFDLRWRLEEGWEVVSRPTVLEVTGSLEDLYVWEYDDAEKTIFLSYAVTATARFRCSREVSDDAGPPSSWYTYREEEEFQAEAHLAVEIVAKVVGEDVTELEVDEVYAP